MKIVSSFGLHKNDDGVWWLVQADGGVNAVGLRADCPFKVDRRRCNHQLNLSLPSPSQGDWQKFMELNHGLVELMLPIPRRATGIFYARTHPNDIASLLRMTSPIRPALHPLWNTNRKELYDELQSSNIQPFCLYQVTPADTQFIKEAGQYAAGMPRTLVYIPDAGMTPPGNSLAIMANTGYPNLDWTKIGAEVVRRFMRGEWE